MRHQKHDAFELWWLAEAIEGCFDPIKYFMGVEEVDKLLLVALSQGVLVLRTDLHIYQVLS